MKDDHLTEAAPGGGESEAARPSSGALELLCREIRERARDLASRARLLASGASGPVAASQESVVLLIEEDARLLADLAEEVLGTRARASPGVGRMVSPAALPQPPDPARPRVMLAEDDPEDREALVAALERDYDLGAFDGGAAVLAAVRAEPPDLLLLDVRMPGMDGLSVLEAVRADPATVEVPVILLSGQADDVTRVRALDLGAADFVQKPVSLGELRARIDRTLRLSRRQSQLRTLAQTDALTGLANLRAFRGRLADEVQRARRYGTPLTCVMVDMDHLKPVNDELGHAAGDRAIAAVADILRAELRTTDLGARYGGDEFVLLLPHTTAAEGHVLADRLCARLERTALEAGDRRILLRASFGVAEIGAGGAEEPAGELVRRADEALYAAKRTGRGRVAIHGADAGPPPVPPPRVA